MHALRRLAAFAAALALASCAGSAPETVEAERADLVTATATVQSVDLPTRRVVFRDDATGEVGAFTAGPEIRNLPQLEPGDRVRLDYVETVAARMAEPGEASEPVSVVAAGRAAEGDKPGGFVAASTDLIVEFVSYDAGSESVRIVTPAGETVTLPVRPEMRDFAASRRPGDRVHVTLSEAVAASIVEIGG